MRSIGFTGKGQALAVAARRERERIARREAILDAAQELMTVQSYNGMRMDSVAEAAELSKGTLYLYFENKDALCAAVATRLIDQLLPVLEQSVENTPTGLDACTALLQRYCDFTQENPQHFRFAFEWLGAGVQMDDSVEAFQIYRGRVGQILSLVVAALQRGQVDGTVRADVDPIPQAMQLWTSFIGVVMVSLNKESIAQRIPVPVDLDQLVPLHLDGIVRALSSEGAS
jgi:AcrR family transcriptional regulator